MSDNDESISNLPRNNPQNEQDEEGVGLIRSGTNISHCNIQNLTSDERVEHQHNDHHQHLHQSINFISTAAPAIQSPKKFDEAKFSDYFRNRIKCTYADMFRKGRPITEDMYDNMPILVESTIEELNTKRANQDEGTTKISEAFPITGDPANRRRLVAIIGEPGAGKSVCLKTLQKYYISKGLFPFNLDFTELSLIKDRMSFPELLKNCACPGFLFDDSKTFDGWLTENEKKCLLLLDGLDQARFLIKENVAPANIQSLATVETWMSLLFAGKLMNGSKVIFTSRPSTIHQLSIAQRPDTVFSLNGFADRSMPHVISKYNNGNKDEILSFIRSKGTSVVNYARNPFIISLIALVYNKSSPSITADTTVTELYSLAFEELWDSTHNSCRGARDTDTETECLVDKFFYQIFVEEKISFTQEDVEEHGLTVKELENFSWIILSVNRAPNCIKAKHKIITPLHQSLMEYQISRHLMKRMEAEEFRNLVQTQMYRLADQDKWVMIRRFLSGHINSGKFDKKKSDIFLHKFASELRNSTSEDLYQKYSGDVEKLNQASLLQANLYNDLVEMSGHLDFIKTAFTTKSSDVLLQVIMKDASSIEGPIFFLHHVDPQLKCLVIILSDDLECAHLQRLATAVEKLSSNVGEVFIKNISPFDGHVKEFGRIFSKTDTMLQLRYKAQVEGNQVEMIKNQFQISIDQLDFTKCFIHLRHRCRRHLIKHSSYTSMTSSIRQPSHYGGERMTVNLTAMDHQIEGNNRLWDFVISHEVQKLTELVKVNPMINISCIRLYVPSDVIDWSYIEMFCETISKVETQEIYLYNLDRREVNCDQVSMLISKVRLRLELFYMEEITPDELAEWKEKLQPFLQLKSPDLDLRIFFKNLTIFLVPQTWELKIRYR